MTIPFKENADPVERAYYWLGQRLLALEEAQAELNAAGFPDLRLSIITQAAYEARTKIWEPMIAADRYLRTIYFHGWLEQRKPFPDRTDPVALKKFTASYGQGIEHPEYFDVALWHGDELCGLAGGGVAGEREHGFVNISLVEGSPREYHPLKGKVLPLVHHAALIYARNTGMNNVAHLSPFSEGAEKQLQRMGIPQGRAPSAIGALTRAYVAPVVPPAPGPGSKPGPA